MLDKNLLLGVGISKDSGDKILELIIRGLEKKQKKHYVVTLNPELLVISSKDPSYKKVLNNAKIASVDGIGVLAAARLFGVKVGKRLTGVDMVKNLCKEVSKKPITVGFLGARPGVAELTAECLQKKYPGLNVVLAESGNPDDKTVSLINKKLNKKTINILFVAFGSPKQEFWIAKNLDKLPVNVAVGVGGAFDFISGKVKRAPSLFRKLGLEWLFRLLIQPWRIKRQLSLIVFIFLVLKQKFLSKIPSYKNLRH